MYSIYADDICIYNDAFLLDNMKIINPKLIMGDNAAGSLSITLPPSNIGYNSIIRMVTDISVRKDDKEIWAGRVLSEDTDFWNNRVLLCEGELAFFNDTTQPQAEYHDKTVRGFLEILVSIHNAKVAKNRQFTVGVVTVTDPNDSLYRYTNYEKTIECINEKLVNRLGGHLRVRKVDGVRYLDYLADYPNTNSQTIEFGKNLLDFTRKWDSTEFATVIIPLGNRLDESPIEALDAYLTVESVNNGSIYVQSSDGVAAYGWIEKVVNWDDVSTASALLTKARAYLSDIQFDNMTIELSALDLHYLNVDYEAVKLLDEIRVISSPHGMDRYFPVTKLEIPLDQPENTQFTLGDNVKATLTSANNATNAEILRKIEVLPKASVILEEAKSNATALLNSATNGYITITQDKYGTNTLYVANNRDYTKATKLWKWNLNGLGYSKDGGKTFGLAITMDGAIVADYITTGTLNADLIKTGTLRDTNSNVVFNLSTGNLTMKKGSININNGKFSVTTAGYLTSTYGKIGGFTIGTSSIYNDVVKLNSLGLWITLDDIEIGKLGVNTWNGDSSYRGLVMDMEYEGSYICWGVKDSATATTYTAKLIYHNNNNKDKKGLHFGCPTYADGNLYITDSYYFKVFSDSAGFYGRIDYVNSSNSTAVTIDGVNKQFAIYNNVDIDFYAPLDMHNWSINNQSDARLKKNIEDTKVDALKLLNSIDLKQFDWIQTDEHEPIGIIAQQLAQFAPELVHEGKDGYLSIKTTKFIFYLIKAVQELSEGKGYKKKTWNDPYSLEKKKRFCALLPSVTPTNKEIIKEPVKIPIRRGG